MFDCRYLKPRKHSGFSVRHHPRGAGPRPFVAPYGPWENLSALRKALQSKPLLTQHN
jgi:hypothetical protein